MSVVMSAAALVTALSACSAGDGPAGSGPAGSSPEVSPTAAPSTPVASTTVPQVPSSPPPSSVAATPEAEPPRDGDILEVDSEATGRLSLLGNGSIVVDTDKGPRELRLADDTVVLDVQGSVCDKGAVPHRCTSAQLSKALKAGVSFQAKVLIARGVAVKVEEIVQSDGGPASD